MAAVESKAGLRRGAIGLTSGVVIGLASAAPAYSLAASLGVLVVLVGEKAPAVMLVAFVPMVLIAVAYRPRTSGVRPRVSRAPPWHRPRPGDPAHRDR